MSDRIALALEYKRQLLSGLTCETVDVGALCVAALSIVAEQALKQPDPDKQLVIAHRQLDETFRAFDPRHP